MQTWYARAIVAVTLAGGCGSTPGGVASDPVVTPSTPATTVHPATATAPEITNEIIVRPPTLACDADARAVPAVAPEPTWACTRADGTRHGPFVTLHPDGAPAVTGAYADGRLAGPWTRRHPGGAIAETGAYVAGTKDGAWVQLAAGGTLLGTYTLARGTGTETTWYETGERYRESALEGGVRHGVTQLFTPGGVVVSTTRYTHGVLDGRHTISGPGVLRLDETFARGVRRGKRSLWVQGALIADEVYDTRGRLDGPYTSWRRPRVLRAQGAYEGGVQVGPWVWVDRAKNKEREGTFVDGERDGVWKEWWESRLVFQGAYTRGRPDGEFIHFDRARREIGRYTITAGTGTQLTYHGNKKPQTTQELKAGKRSGRYQELSPQGKVLVEGHYRADEKHGTWRTWTPDHTPLLEQTWKRGRLDGVVRKFVRGQVAMETTYVAGKAHGPYAEFRDGRPAVTGQFVEDRRAGTWTTFDRDGRAVLTSTYAAGVLDGPWRQVIDGAVLEGAMAAGRRTGTWTRTDAAGVVAKTTYAAL